MVLGSHFGIETFGAQTVGFDNFSLVQAGVVSLPLVTNDAPAAGKRVRVTAPGSGYEGNPNVYHTLYLPPD